MKLKNLFEETEKKLIDMKIKGKTVLLRGKIRGIWTGDFDFCEKGVTSLDGSPVEVFGDYNCSFNDITSLSGAPKKVHGDFFCYGTKIKSLDGLPEKIGGCISIEFNKLDSLKGCPDIVNGGGFDCSHNNIRSFDGAPKKVNGNFKASNCKFLSDINDIPEYIKSDLYLDDCESLMSLKDIHKHLKKMGYGNGYGGCVHAYRSGIKSHVLGLLLIDGCNQFNHHDDTVSRIMNKYLSQPFTPHRVYECQDELIEAGFEEYAQL